MEHPVGNYVGTGHEVDGVIITSGGKAIAYEHEGVRQTPAEWAAQTGIKEATIRSRIKRNWPLGRALFEPLTVKPKPTGSTMFLRSHAPRSPVTPSEEQARRGVVRRRTEDILSGLALEREWAEVWE